MSSCVSSCGRGPHARPRDQQRESERDAADEDDARDRGASGSRGVREVGGGAGVRRCGGRSTGAAARAVSRQGGDRPRPRSRLAGPAGAAVERGLLHRDSIDTPPRVRGKVARVPRVVTGAPARWSGRTTGRSRTRFPAARRRGPNESCARTSHGFAPFLCLAPWSSMMRADPGARGARVIRSAPVRPALVRPARKRFDEETTRCGSCGRTCSGSCCWCPR